MALGLQLMTAQAMAAGADSAALRRARRQAGSAGSLVGLTVVLASPLVADVLNMTSWVPFAILGAGVPVYFVMAVDVVPRRPATKSADWRCRSASRPVLASW